MARANQQRTSELGHVQRAVGNAEDDGRQDRSARARRRSRISTTEATSSPLPPTTGATVTRNGTTTSSRINLVAHPECEIGGEAFRATEVTGEDEYSRLYGLAERYYGGFADYKAKTALVGRKVPVFRLTPALTWQTDPRPATTEYRLPFLEEADYGPSCNIRGIADRISPDHMPGRTGRTHRRRLVLKGAEWKPGQLSGPCFFEEMISIGQSVCSALDRSPGHSTFVSAVNNIVAKGVFNPLEARGIGSSAIAAYCPNHNDSAFG